VSPNARDIAPVKLIAAVLYRREEALAEALEQAVALFSTIDYRGEFFPFRESDYYVPEMGPGLQRGLIAFEKLVHPGFLAPAKRLTRDLENRLAIDGKRQVNIDIGYLDLFKVVLASFKGRTNKIYLSDGVWAAMVLYFEKGGFHPFLWSFPDFKSGIYDPSLQTIRSTYKSQLQRDKAQTG